MTDAEKMLWRELRMRQFDAHKFRRQFPLGPYIVDFVCLDARLIIEVDGGQHQESPEDRRRDAWLSAQGFRVLRFWNNDVMNDLYAVSERIWAELHPHPDLPPSRGKELKEPAP